MGVQIVVFSEKGRRRQLQTLSAQVLVSKQQAQSARKLQPKGAVNAEGTLKKSTQLRYLCVATSKVSKGVC